METILLSRKRPTEYVINYHNGIKQLTYKWAGCKKGSNPHTIPVPREVFDYLNMHTSAIKGGALVIADKNPNKTEILNEMIEDDVALATANSHTHEEITALLKGNINKMKKELSAITSRQEKMFVNQIKNEIVETDGLNSNKLDFIEEWLKENPVQE